MKLLYIFLYLSCMGLLFSCGKSNDNATGSKLKKLVETNLNQVTNYEYENGLLVSASKTAQHQSGEYIYQYAADRLSGIQVEEVHHYSSGDVTDKYRMIFKYENEQRLSEILLNYETPFLPGNGYINKYEFYYSGDDEKFSTCIRYAQNGAGNPSKSKYEFKYDARGNVSECINYIWGDNNWELLVGTRYTYSRAANPVYMLGDPADFINYMSRDLWIESNVFVSGPYVYVVPQIKRSYLLGFSGQVTSVSIKEPIDNELTYHY